MDADGNGCGPDRPTVADVRVEFERLDGPTWGYYDPDRRVICIDSRLTQAERRCTLAHELLHAERRDEPCVTAWHEAKQERLVEGLAARRLVSLPALADALAWTQDEFEMADVLGVDLATVRARVAGLSAVERRALQSRLRRRGQVA